MKLFGQISQLVKIIFKQNGFDISLDSNTSTTYTANRDLELPPGDANEILVGEASTQALSNKTIDGDLNTVQDLPVTAIKTVLGDADKVILRDASGVPTSAKIVNANVDSAAAIDATKIADGSVSNTEFQLLNGVTGSLVTPSSSDTFTNKTIDGDDNTVQDIALTSIKTDLANADKVIRRDSSGVIQNGNTIPNNQPLVTTTSAQTLEEKDIDGGTANNGRRLTIPKNTTSNLAALTRKQATLAYDTTLAKVVVDDGSGFSPVGGSGGSGFPTANIRASEGAGSTTLTSSDSRIQVFNISANRNCRLPTTGITAGDVWEISNKNAFMLSVQASDLSNITQLYQGTIVLVALINTPVTLTDWEVTQLDGKGNWTPTVTAGTNVNSVLTVNKFQYTRVGNIVTFAGQIEITTTSNDTTTSLTFTTPIGSNFTSAEDANGICGGFGTSSQGYGYAGQLYADTSLDEITLVFRSIPASAQQINISGMYEIK